MVHGAVFPLQTAANLLVDNENNIKIADFGLAREVPSGSARVRNTDSSYQPVMMTKGVVSLWYRAPELLLHVPEYSFAVDIWAAG